MAISILFDYFETKCYIEYKGAKIMNKFIVEKQIVTQIVLAVFVPIGSGNAVHKNRPSHGIALNCGGEKKYVFDDGTVYTVCENDLIYLPKYSSYEVRSIVPGDTWCINFQCINEERFSPFICHIPNAESLVKAYQSAEKIWTRAKSGREYHVLSELYKILYEVNRLHKIPYLPKTKQNLILPAVNYIHKHYTDELLNMGKLSELCGISYDYLRKLFEKFYGCSPIKYVNALKLKRAQELLGSGDYSVSEAALNSGFSDLSHFCRFFKEKVGVLPSEYIIKQDL